MQATESAVLVEREDQILIVTINRPAARNAVNAAVHTGLGRALQQAESDPDIRVVVLTGAGEKAFCAGADLKALARGESSWPDDPEQKRWGWAGFVRHPISKPIIAAVNGFALGGGTELALACDIVIAADHVEFGLPEVKRGIFAAAGGAFRLAHQLPPKIAMELLLTGDSFSAQRAFELGFANRVVPSAELMKTVMTMARKIAANAPLSVQASKRIANGIAEGTIASERDFWAANKREGAIVMTSADAREGPRAFAEKRAPAWQGR
ncbi:crotonase/enoyl-CoA hydratase family protein [Sphingopyxis sp. MG]|uniref:crotonase/enoyl-CoA hydratase family protein n=1 Tax=Sphingopyxis sp. MG TaxID=1866325 RepID=UPI000CDF50BC|nr:crotonase/enoyl-CoA hydratase family protein [Sphingopyxis sp. MG]AVA14647.1 enoyl-CoA hydratase [Sphingopyxis sp. MG]